MVTETRLRAALASDKATKHARGLEATVRNGVAELRGPVDAEVARAATRVAERTPGVVSVRDATRRGRTAASACSELSRFLPERRELEVLRTGGGTADESYVSVTVVRDGPVASRS